MLTKIARIKEVLRCFEEKENFKFLEESSRKDIEVYIKAANVLRVRVCAHNVGEQELRQTAHNSVKNR